MYVVPETLLHAAPIVPPLNITISFGTGVAVGVGDAVGVAVGVRVGVAVGQFIQALFTLTTLEL